MHKIVARLIEEKSGFDYKATLNYLKLAYPELTFVSSEEQDEFVSEFIHGMLMGI